MKKHALQHLTDVDLGRILGRHPAHRVAEDDSLLPGFARLAIGEQSLCAEHEPPRLGLVEGVGADHRLIVVEASSGGRGPDRRDAEGRLHRFRNCALLPRIGRHEFELIPAVGVTEYQSRARVAEVDRCIAAIRGHVPHRHQQQINLDARGRRPLVVVDHHDVDPQLYRGYLRGPSHGTGSLLRVLRIDHGDEGRVVGIHLDEDIELAERLLEIHDHEVVLGEHLRRRPQQRADEPSGILAVLEGFG